MLILFVASSIESTFKSSCILSFLILSFHRFFFFFGFFFFRKTLEIIHNTFMSATLMLWIKLLESIQLSFPHKTVGLSLVSLLNSLLSKKYAIQVSFMKLLNWLPNAENVIVFFLDSFQLCAIYLIQFCICRVQVASVAIFKHPCFIVVHLIFPRPSFLFDFIYYCN